MKETTQPPKDPKKKLWIGYAVILSIVILSNIFLFPALMQASVKSVNYSTFLQMLEDKELSTVQIEDQQIYFVDKNENSYKTNAIAQDNNLVARLEDAGVEFGTVYQSPTIWDSLLNLVISFLPMILLFWFVNRWATKKMQEMGGAGGNAMLFGGKSGAKQYVVDDETGMYLLRSAADCPEIDGSIMTPADTPLEAGAFYNVTITDADTYDLYGYAESKVEE